MRATRSTARVTSAKKRPSPRASAPGRPISKSARRRRVQQRRAVVCLAASAVFAVVVLATSLPVSVLFDQHTQLQSKAEQLSALESQNGALRQEARQLTNRATVADIARRDYGLVAPGSKAYEILPSPGSQGWSSTESGSVPLDSPPVMPGSVESQELLSAGALSIGESVTGAGSKGAGSASTSDAHPGDGSPGGFWTRVLDSLEFWK